MKSLILLLFLAGFSSAYGQGELAEYGTLQDVKGKTKVYVSASADNRMLILKEITNNKKLTTVAKPEDADLIIEYKVISRDEKVGIVGGTGLSSTYENGQLDVYFFRDKKKVIAWSEAKTHGWYEGPASKALVKKFLKELGKK